MKNFIKSLVFKNNVRFIFFGLLGVIGGFCIYSLKCDNLFFRHLLYAGLIYCFTHAVIVFINAIRDEFRDLLGL